MKPIKFLLSLCAVLMVAVGAWAQAPTIAVPSNPSSPQCIGATISYTLPTITTGAISCNSLGIIVELVDNIGTPIAGTQVTAGTVSSPTSPVNLVIPSSPGQRFVRVRTNTVSGDPCYVQAISPIPGFTIPVATQAAGGAVISAPVASGVANNGTAAIEFCRATAATNVTITPAASCGAGATVEIYSDQSDATVGAATASFDISVAAATYTLYVGCQVTGGCQTPGADRVPVTIKINDRPAAPAAATLTTQANCLGQMPTITQSNVCAAGTELVFYKNATDLLTSTDVAVAGSWNLAAACRNLTTGCVTPYATTIWVTGGGNGTGSGGTATSLYTVVTPPAFTAAPTINGTGAVQSNTNTTATICQNDITGSLVFTGTCPAGVPGVLSARVKLYTDVALTTEVGTSASPDLTTAYGAIAAPAATTTYYAVCQLDACKGPVTTLTWVVKPTPAAPTVTALPTVCAGTSVSITAATYATCLTGDPMVNGTATATIVVPASTTTGTYTAAFTCVLNGCVSATTTTGTGVATGQPIDAGATSALTKTAICASEAGTPIGILAHGCATSDVPFVSSSLTGAPVLASGIETFAAPASTTTYYLFCKNVGTGCISQPHGAGTLTVNPNPIDPISTPVLSRTSAPCPTDLGGPLTINATCSNVVTEQLVVFTSNSPSATPIVTLSSSASAAIFAVPSTTTSYWVACRNTGTLCVGVNKIAAGTFTVNAALADPTGVSISATGATGNGTTALSICASSAASLLPITASGVCGTGSVLLYDNNTTALGGLNPRSIDLFSTPGVYTYYVGCVSGSCESPAASRVAVTFTINSRPTVGSPTLSASACIGVVPTIVTSTCSSGSTATLMKAATGATLVTAADVMTSGAKTFYVECTTAEGCTLFTRATVSYTVTAAGAPTGTLTKTDICASDAGTPIGIATHNCPTSDVPFVSSSNTGTPVLASASGTFAAPAATTTYYLFCRNVSTNCISDPAAQVVTVNANPIDPISTPVLSRTSAPCPTDLGPDVTITATCSNTVTERLVVFTSDSPSATPISLITSSALSATFAAPSATTTYWVACRNTTTLCVGVNKIAAGTFTVNAALADPTGVSISATGATGNGTTALSICGTLSSSLLPITASGVCGTGSVRLYDNNTTALGGLNPRSIDIGNAPGVYTYYVGCVSGSCESPAASRVAVTFTINRTPVAPSLSMTPSGPVCQGSELVFTTACGATTDVAEVWGSKDGGAFALVVSEVNATTLKATPATGGSYTYKARCVSTLGCPSAYSATTSAITVNPVIAAPTIAPNATTALVPSSICTGNTAILNNNLTCTPSQVLVWYLSNSTSAVAIATPNTTPVSTTTYYVACKETNTALECETPAANRYMVTFTVNPIGGTPTNASLTADNTTVAVGQNKAVCNDVSSNTITFTGCASGETTLYSVDGASYTTTVPMQMVDGIAHNYRIRCQAGSGSSACVGPESGVMTLTINVQPTGKPTAALSPMTVCATTPASTPFGGSSSCGALATVWFEVTGAGDVQLASLPQFIPGQSKTYYAKCMGTGGCIGEKSDNVTFTIIPNTTAPVITSTGGEEVCTGVNVTLTTNCPVGSTVVWSNGFNGSIQPLVSNVSQVIAVTAKCITTVNGVTCESPVSALKTIVWKSFDLTVINIGASQSGIKPGANVPKSAWAANFVTVDAGPSLQSSSQGNPSVFFTENPNKGGPRFWTIHVEACALGTAGSIGFDMLCTPEVGVPASFNTTENNAPYLMYANRDGFTELYAQNHPAYGFFNVVNGVNTYDSGLPKGLYKLSVRYFDQKGQGSIYPATRTRVGNVLAYQEYWFRIQSQNGIGSGAAREGVSETSEVEFATVAPNPVTRTLTLAINGAKGQEVKMNLVDAAGRIIKSSTVTPETNTHREEVDMSSQTTGMYFMNISTSTKRANLKVLKVSND